MATVTSPSLSYFCIFNPTYCYSDETLRDQLFFYTSKAEHVSEDEQIRKVGLIQGIISFASDFSGKKPVEVIDTKKTRTVVTEIEPNWWIVLCINFTKIQTPIESYSKTTASSAGGAARNGLDGKSKHSNGPLASLRRRKTMGYKTDFSRKEAPSCNAMHTHILRGYNQWKLFYGELPPSCTRTRKDGKKRECEKADDSLVEFRVNLNKFWNWWLHKWDLYIYANATWGGTLNNSFLVGDLVLGSAPTLSFSFMDSATAGMKQPRGGLSEETIEVIKATVKREAKNGLVDLVILRINKFSLVGPGGRITKPFDTEIDNYGPSSSSAPEKVKLETASLYSNNDDAVSIISSVSQYNEQELAEESDLEEVDSQNLFDDELRSGCIFQGLGYLSRSSIAEYCRWVIDNHIFPSPSVLEGVRWSLYSNKAYVDLPLSSLTYSFKENFQRPRSNIRLSKIQRKKIADKRSSMVVQSFSKGIVNGMDNSLSAKSISKIAIEQATNIRDTSLALLHKVTSGSTTASVNTTTTKATAKLVSSVEDLSDAKFLVGYHGDLDFDEDDSSNDEENLSTTQRKQIENISVKEVYARRRRKQRQPINQADIQTDDEQEISSTMIESSASDLSTGASLGTINDKNSGTLDSQNRKFDKLRVVIYKRAPFVFSAFFDSSLVDDNVLDDPNYYKSLHLRLGSLAEPIWNDFDEGN
ncbi:hypothetical protein V1511DRAFT_512046 [Dipodascopsis uninucleata]